MPKKFSPELRDRAVRMVYDRQALEGGPRSESIRAGWSITATVRLSVLAFRGSNGIEPSATASDWPRLRPSLRSVPGAIATIVMAEALNSLFKAECIRNPVMRPKGGWKSVTEIEIATAEYVDWFNHRRLHGEIGMVPPVEFEAIHWATVRSNRYPEAPVPVGAGTN